MLNPHPNPRYRRTAMRHTGVAPPCRAVGEAWANRYESLKADEFAHRHGSRSAAAGVKPKPWRFGWLRPGLTSFLLLIATCRRRSGSAAAGIGLAAGAGLGVSAVGGAGALASGPTGIRGMGARRTRGASRACLRTAVGCLTARSSSQVFAVCDALSRPKRSGEESVYWGVAGRARLPLPAAGCKGELRAGIWLHKRFCTRVQNLSSASRQKGLRPRGMDTAVF